MNTRYMRAVAQQILEFADAEGWSQEDGTRQLANMAIEAAALLEQATLAPHAVAMPEPNWQDAPEWANYWTHDSTGNAMLWETKPLYDSKYGIWINEDDSRRAQGTVAAVIRQRPTPAPTLPD